MPWSDGGGGGVHVLSRQVLPRCMLFSARVHYGFAITAAARQHPWGRLHTMEHELFSLAQPCIRWPPLAEALTDME